MSFESDLKRMEEITQLLKNPETGLEKSIELYEEGSRLAKELSRTLDQIQRKVEKVTSIDENELETVELDDEGNEEKDIF
ncbi:MAG: exodeoxyribonuclease VII small subunit [Candidatus Ornithospirochaeta sp.]|nr:exodeoxyribonuclease VII small subunit [Sphaerochaetaceae bacterium]MDY5523247.1 exodeoxyribonuclease VII small subunit [Candidatus Ornithospirochaeta sp.]